MFSIGQNRVQGQDAALVRALEDICERVVERAVERAVTEALREQVAKIVVKELERMGISLSAGNLTIRAGRPE